MQLPVSRHFDFLISLKQMGNILKLTLALSCFFSLSISFASKPQEKIQEIAKKASPKKPASKNNSSKMNSLSKREKSAASAQLNSADKLIISGKLIARNKHLFAIKPRSGTVTKIPVTYLPKENLQPKKGDVLAVQVPVDVYERFNKTKK